MWWPFGRKYPERRVEEVDSLEFDYVIVGGEIPELSVLVLELGPARDTFLSRIPMDSANILKVDGVAKSWLAEPMIHCNDRRTEFYRGEVLGGGSWINAMVYTRGCKADYDLWAALGHPEWSFEKVLPYFIKSEKTLNQPQSNYRGIADFNGPGAHPDGVGSLDMTIDDKSQRVSSLDAFLPRELALQREKNLIICTNAIVSHIVFSQKGKKPLVDEVIFTSARKGIDNGIRPRDHLEKHAIDVVQDLPGVDSNLADHRGIPVAWEVLFKESLAYVANSPVTVGGIEFLKYIFFRSGLLSMPAQQSALFDILSFLRGMVPDAELIPIAFSAMDNPEEYYRLWHKFGIFSLLSIFTQPKSVGSVRLASSNPRGNPKVDFGILSDPEDYVFARKVVRLSLKLGDAIKAAGFPLIQNLTFSHEQLEKDIKSGNNEEIDEFIRGRIRTCFRWASSCRMSPEHDATTPGVVDDELRVYVVSG
ncbi:hypothetical protein BJ878DRAFT_583486 [Calycina marina]|uniref:Glucose-methanol-choline oxidoreductase N-terminal domain-containing protein n=1 Tax=Calycina marina TaxID=1763456 RepID=A0A9P7Z058_9HELO|nr:hypothetical protein BJ878DRAFT_583486 [Calycina marina]